MFIEIQVEKDDEIEALKDMLKETHYCQYAEHGVECKVCEMLNTKQSPEEE